MSAPPFTLGFTPEAKKILEDLDSPAHKVKAKKIKKALRLLRDAGPGHPGLNSHTYHSITGPRGEEVWECYVENHTPGAWRIWWVYGPNSGEITVVSIDPHP